MTLLDNILNSIFLLLCGISVSLVSGCASLTGENTYPIPWEDLEQIPTTDGCPHLAGTYSNLGDATFPSEKGTPTSLTKIFTRLSKASGQTWDVPLDATSVSINQTPETLKVTFLGNSKALCTLDFRRYHFNFLEKRYDDLFTCYVSENGIRLRLFPELDAGALALPNLFVGGGATLIFLLKANDGSLIVQARSESLGISAVLIGTHLSFDSVWWRFPKVTGSR